MTWKDLTKEEQDRAIALLERMAGPDFLVRIAQPSYGLLRRVGGSGWPSDETPPSTAAKLRKQMRIVG